MASGQKIEKTALARVFMELNVGSQSNANLEALFDDAEGQPTADTRDDGCNDAATEVATPRRKLLIRRLPGFDMSITSLMHNWNSESDGGTAVGCSSSKQSTAKAGKADTSSPSC